MQATLLIHLIKKKKKKFFCQAEKNKQHSREKIPEVSSLYKVKGHHNLFLPYISLCPDVHE